MEEDPFGRFGLKSVTMNERSRFSAYFQALRSPLSDYTFSQLFTWGNSLRILWKEIRGHLCVFANGTGDLTLLMPPIGDTGSESALAEAFEVMDAYNAAQGCGVGRSRVEYVSEELLARFDATRLSVTPMGADYVYDTRRMIDLAGGDLASKRQLKNRFLRNFEHRVEAYDPSVHRAACVELLRSWKSHQDANASSAAADASDARKRQKESLACELALEHATALGLKGLVVHVRPANAESAAASGLPTDAFALRGFTFGEELGTDQSSILIEKTDLQVRGLAQYIFSEFCGRDWSHLPLVNAGDDWGLESLTWTKMSYRPVRLLQKHVLRMNRPVTVAVKPQLPAAEPEVRPARREDLAAALVLEQRCFSAHCLTKRQLGYLQRRPSAVFVVAEQGGKLIGQGISLVRTHKKGQTGRIYSLSVSEEARGKRIGLRLLRSMMEKLAGRGVKRVYLEVEEGNDRAIRLYERNGFTRVGRLDDYYGEGKHGLHMMCELGALSAA